MICVDEGRVVSSARVRQRAVGMLAACCLIAAILLHPSTAFAGTHYYVDSVNGSDSNPGTSDRPWRTIQKAANTMVGGDVAHVQAGQYPERVRVTRAGSAGAPLTFQAEGTVVTRGFTLLADYLTVRGFEVTDTPNHNEDGVGIYCEASHCVIEDNYVHYATRAGIVVYARPGDWGVRTNSVVRNNRLYRNALVGIEIHGRNHVVEGNEIWRTIQYHPAWTPAPSWADADGIRFFGSGHVVRRNYIHDITYSDPENVNPHIDCFQTWSSEWHEAGNNIVFEQNWCQVLESLTANASGNAFMLADARDLVIRNNVLQAFKHINTGGGGNSNLRIVNNTMTSKLSFPLSNYPAGVGLENCPNATVKNNVFFNLPAHIYYVTGTSVQGLDIGYNLAYREDGAAPSGSPYSHDLWGVNPGFVNAGGGDYHLQAGSPAVDAGLALGSLVPDDYDGATRPKGAGYDMGAFECGGSAPPTATATSVPPTSTAVPPPPVSGEFIMDDKDPGFSAVSIQDSWQEYVQAGGEHYGDSHFYNRQIGTGKDIATWSFTVQKPGRYAVHAWWCGGEWRPTDVPFVIKHLGGSTIVKLNQQIDGGQWNYLGTYEFFGPGSVAVNDAASSGQDIVADAIWVRYAGSLDPGALYKVYLPFVRR